MSYRYLIDKLEAEQLLSEREFIDLFCMAADTSVQGQDGRRYLCTTAKKVTERHFGKNVFIRGLIEFSNFCKNDCYYCGIRRSNKNCMRYRLSSDEILVCCREGYMLGFRTFVLQSGEDPAFTEDQLVALVQRIKSAYPDCAITLSTGEKSTSEYNAYRAAGADRYLLRHETADCVHYAKLKPPELTFENRMRCLSDLQSLGFQTGCGFMVGSPGQTPECLAADLSFIHTFKPQMIGIGPFIPHRDTPFASFPAGSVSLTLVLISLLRLMHPAALIPATTALGTADPDGREKGLSAGANVVMPNLSPLSVRSKYQLYDNKICTESESAQCLACLSVRLKSIDRHIIVSRGDYEP